MINLHSIIKDDVFNDAACLGTATETFFPAKADDYGPARATCAECPLMTQQTCLELAMHAEKGTGPSGRAGMFGGLTPTERSRLQRERDTA